MPPPPPSSTLPAPGAQGLWRAPWGPHEEFRASPTCGFTGDRAEGGGPPTFSGTPAAPPLPGRSSDPPPIPPLWPLPIS